MMQDDKFNKYNLDELLRKPRAQLEMEDSLSVVFSQLAYECLQSAQGYLVAKRVADAYSKIGNLTNLLEDYGKQLDAYGIREQMMTPALHPSIIQDMKKKTSESLVRYCIETETDQLTRTLQNRVAELAKEVEDILADVKSTYIGVDAKEFGKLQMYGYPHEIYVSRVNGLHRLMGAYNALNPADYGKVNVMEKFTPEYMASAFTYHQSVLFPPGDSGYEYKSLEDLAWTPEKVYGCGESLLSALRIHPGFQQILLNCARNLRTLDDVKQMCQMVENTHNARITAVYTGKTLVRMAEQWLKMVRAFK